MVILKRIEANSAGRFGFWFGFVGSVANVVIGLTIAVMQGLPLELLGSEFWMGVVFSIMISSFVTAVIFGAFATIYNSNPQFFGGLKLEFEALDTPTRKAKNGDGDHSGDEDITIV